MDSLIPSGFFVALIILSQHINMSLKDGKIIVRVHVFYL